MPLFQCLFRDLVWVEPYVNKTLSAASLGRVSQDSYLARPTSWTYICFEWGWVSTKEVFMKNVLALQKLAPPAGLSVVAAKKSGASKGCGNTSTVSLLLCKKA